MKLRTDRPTGARSGLNVVLAAGLALLMILLVVSGSMAAETVSRKSPVVLAVHKVGPAVVNISSRQEVRRRSNPFSGFSGHPFFDSFFRDFFDPDFEQHYQRTSLGSGVIIDGRRGYILTNAHVVEETASINVVLKDEREFKAQIVGADPDSDLAVLRIESETPLPDVKMGTSKDLMIGETVIAIGNPFGFSHTVTTGVVSALNRTVRADNHLYRNFIQTDASINPGNSGGPLLNIHGELIGINTAVYAKAQGIGFAIPIDRAKKIISDLIQHGEVIESWIGLIIQPLDDDLARYLKIPDRLRRKEGGMLVKKVFSASPARKAGIRAGDVILSIGRRPIASRSDYRATLKETPIGQTLSMEIWRDTRLKKMIVKTAHFPKGLAESLARKILGISVTDITPKIRGRYRLDTKEGVAIQEIDRQSHLARIGVRPGDVIRQIDEMTINNLKDFDRAITRYRHKTSMVILVQRGDQLYYLTVKI